MNSKTSSWKFLSLLLLTVWLPGITVSAENAGSIEPKIEVVSIKDELFNLELAITPEQRRQGLMQRRELAPGAGMLFVFPKLRIQRFWMAHTLIELDVIFLNSEGGVINIASMKPEPPPHPHETEADYHARLPTYRSSKPAQFAIEFPAGTADFLNLRAGDKIAIDTERLLKMAQ